MELKGNDIAEASRQLSVTLSDFKRRFGYKRYYGRIVTSLINIPKISPRDYDRLPVEYKKTGESLKMKSIQLDERLSESFSL